MNIDIEKEKLSLNCHNTIDNHSQRLFINQIFEEQVKKTPHNISIVCGDDHLTYTELNDRANKFANYVSKHVSDFSNVAVCIERSIESIIIFLGILKSGNTYVPLDPNYPSELINFIINNSSTKNLITQNKFAKRFDTIGITLHIAENFSKLVDCESSILKDKEGAHFNRLAVVLYTSGTTAKPKGVRLTHQGLVSRILWMHQFLDPDVWDRTLHKTSVCFDISLWEIFLPLLSGGTLICAGADVPKDSEELVRLIQDENVTITHFVPQMLKYFIDTKNVEKCYSLKHVFVSGDVLHLRTQERFFSKMKCNLHNLYGPTETSIDVTHWHCQRNSTLSFVPIGRPISNANVYLLNDSLDLVENDTIGQIYIGGDCLAQGYTDPVLTNQYFIVHPKYGLLYQSGDLAKRMADNTLEFVCRNDRQIKLGGYRVELSAIEETIALNTNVHSIAVTYRENAPGFKEIIAYVVLNNKNKIEICVSKIRDYIKKILPIYMMPNIFVIIDDIPLTFNFKVNYLNLPSLNNLKKINDYIYVI